MDRSTEKRYRRIRQLRIRAVIAFAVALALLTAMIEVSTALNTKEQAIRVALGQKNYSVDGEEGEQYFESAYSEQEQLRKDSADKSREIAEEGMVLLRNEGGVLPLKSGAKISVFGEASVNPVYSGSVKGAEKSSLRDALQEEGFEINEDLWSFEERGGGISYSRKVLKSMDEYSEAALVVIGREGSGTESSVGESHALRLTEDERAVLQTARDNCDTVLVVLNADNPLEMGFLEEYEVNACLWTGSWGQGSAEALAEILSGSVNPSGRLTDTYVYDDLSAPAARNLGDYSVVNSSVAGGDKYLTYQEGIYIGYRYYETRYEDVALENTSSDSLSAESQEEAGSSGTYDYTAEVAYPFGYGQSYTSFTWSEFSVDFSKNIYTVSVQVTNSGDVAGADVVEIYLQKPYSEQEKQKGVEVPSVELAGFAKTYVLAPGESETVSVEVSAEECRTYDAFEAGTYIVEAGEYYLTAARDAHEAVNNILLAKGVDTASSTTMTYQFLQKERDTQTYAVSRQTGAAISNRFSSADPATYDAGFQKLTRSDWTGTMPTEAWQQGNYTASSSLLSALSVSSGEDGNASSPVYNTVHGEEYLTLAALREASTSDYHWNWLLDQMSWKENYSLVRKGGGVINDVLTCSAPQAQIAEGRIRTLYPSSTVWAATWDTNLIRQAAELIGEEALAGGISIWRTPSLNLHRTALGDENGSSYSEDSFLTGEMAAAVCRGLSEKGVIPLMGRFILGEQATNYHGVAVFAQEQAIRELYLESFERAIEDGGSGVMAVMAGMNRVGGRWCGGSSSLLTEVLRGEWGFGGIVMTDTITGSGDSYCDILEGLEAGTDVWQNTADDLLVLKGSQLTYGVRARFRRAAGRILQAISRSNAMNGIGPETTLHYQTAGWKYWRNAADIGIVLLTGAILWYAWRQWRRAGRIHAKIQEEERRRRRKEIAARARREQEERTEMERMEKL